MMLMSFWDQITDIFRSAEESSPAAPTIHELIDRDEATLADYDHWKRTLGRRRLLNWLTDQYAVNQGGGRTDEAVGFLDTNSSKGFVIYFHKTNYQKAEIQHFFDYLKERMMQLGYRSQISDRRIFPRRDWVETQERHYVKPRNKYREGSKLNQRFGNVMIEFELRNDVPHNLRLRATIYVDAQYEKPASFSALMMALSAEENEG
jgi:hypothetical protein